MAGHRHRVHRRGLGRRGRPRRLPAAGAAARSRQDRARQRHGGRRPPSRRCSTATTRLPMNYSDETADEMAQAAGRDRRPEPVGPRQPRSTWPWTRCAARPTTPTSPSSPAASGAAWRCAGCCSTQPDLLLLDEPTNHLDAESVAWLEGHLRELSGRHPDRHPRPLFPRQRHRLDPRARPRPRHPLRGQLHRPGSSRSRSGWSRRAARTRRASARSQREQRMDRASRPRRARPSRRRAISAYEELLKQSPTRKTPGTAQIIIPVGRAARPDVVEVEHLTKGFGDQLLIDDLTFKLPPGGIVGVIGPNGAGKTTLFRMITGQEKPDEGTITIGETVHLGYVDQSRDALDGKKTVWEEISDGQDIIQLGKHEMNSPRLCRGLQLQGRRPAEEGRPALGRRAQPRASRQDAAARAPTCCCSTSRPTTSTSTRCARWKRRWRISPAAPSSSATTAGSSTASPPTSSPSRATATSNGSRATSRTTRPTRCAAWARTAIIPHRLKYKKFTR